MKKEKDSGIADVIAPLEEDHEQHLQWQACLSDERWKEFSSTKGLNRLVDSDGNASYKLELTLPESHIIIREKESFRKL